MLFFKTLIFSTLIFPISVMAEDLAGPPSIFTLDDVVGINAVELTDPLAIEGIEAEIENAIAPLPTKEFLEEKPYKAELSFVNRRTNTLSKLQFNHIERTQAYNKLSVTVAQCLKSYDEKFGNDIAFVEIINAEESVLFSGWIFKKRPSTHTFEHPVYSLALLGC